MSWVRVRVGLGLGAAAPEAHWRSFREPQLKWENLLTLSLTSMEKYKLSSLPQFELQYVMFRLGGLNLSSWEDGWS